MHAQNKINQGLADAQTSAQELALPNTQTSTGGDENSAKEDVIANAIGSMDLFAKRMSGASRKRTKHFLKEGYSPEDARKMAEKPIEQDAKRRKGNSSTSTSTQSSSRKNETKAPKKPSGKTRGCSSSIPWLIRQTRMDASNM